MYDDDDDYDEYDIENQLDKLQDLFCKNVYNEIINGGIVDIDDIEETIIYYSKKEDYEKCIKLKKSIKKIKKRKNV